MSISIATVSLSGSLEQKLRAAARAGFDAVEIFEPDLVASPLSAGEVRDLADDLGLAIPMYQPLRDFEGVDAKTLERNLRRARLKFELMNDLGAETLLVCSSVAPDSIDDPELAAAQLHRLADDGGRARGPRRLRGARLGSPRERLQGGLANRRAGRPPEPRHLHRLLPHPLARHDPAGIATSPAGRSSSSSSLTHR